MPESHASYRHNDEAREMTAKYGRALATKTRIYKMEVYVLFREL